MGAGCARRGWNRLPLGRRVRGLAQRRRRRRRRRDPARRLLPRRPQRPGRPRRRRQRLRADLDRRRRPGDREGRLLRDDARRGRRLIRPPCIRERRHGAVHRLPRRSRPALVRTPLMAA